MSELIRFFLSLMDTGITTGILNLVLLRRGYPLAEMW